MYAIPCIWKLPLMESEPATMSQLPKMPIRSAGAASWMVTEAKSEIDVEVVMLLPLTVS